MQPCCCLEGPGWLGSHAGHRERNEAGSHAGHHLLSTCVLQACLPLIILPYVDHGALHSRTALVQVRGQFIGHYLSAIAFAALHTGGFRTARIAHSAQTTATWRVDY